MPLFPRSVSNVVEFIQRRGAGAAIGEIGHRLADAYWEWRLGVRIEGMVRKDELDCSDRDSLER